MKGIPIYYQYPEPKEPGTYWLLFKENTKREVVGRLTDRGCWAGEVADFWQDGNPTAEMVASLFLFGPKIPTAVELMERKPDA